MNCDSRRRIVAAESAIKKLTPVKF